MRDAAGSLTTLAWLVPLAAGAAILATYFLKTRRKPVLVPSTYLWRRTIEDRRVNAFWQRLRRSLLLLVQLAAVAAAAFALGRPSWEGSVLVGGRYVFLIDNSAGMSAVDTAPSRLDEAKRRILALVERMGSGDRAMVVSFAGAARVEQALTDNRRLLRSAIREIRPTDEPTSLAGALRLAVGHMRTAAPQTDADRPAGDGTKPEESERPPQIFIAGDGLYSDPRDEDLQELGPPPVFLPVGTPQARNLAITALAIRRTPTGRVAQALAKIRNYCGQTEVVDLELRHGERLLDARRVELAAGAPHDALFTVADAPDGLWELRMTKSQAAAGGPPEETRLDHLAVDDRAWGLLSPPRKTRLLVVTSGNRYLVSALATEEARRWCDATFKRPEFLTTSEYALLAAGGELEAVFYDRCRPPTMPACDTLFFGALPPGDDWKEGKKIDVPRIIDAAEAHPLLWNTSPTEVLVAEATSPAGPSGAQVLLDSDRGALALIAPRDGFEDAVFGFSLLSADGTPLTNWPLVDGAGFEQFVLNVAQYFGRDRGGEGATSLRPGEPLRFRPDSAGESAAATVTIVGPDGTETRVDRSAQGDFSFYATERVGPYRVVGGPTFVVNLFDPRESEIATPAEPVLRIGGEEISGDSSWEAARLEGWKPILLIVLALLLAEWYIYGARGA